MHLASLCSYFQGHVPSQPPRFCISDCGCLFGEPVVEAFYPAHPPWFPRRVPVHPTYHNPVLFIKPLALVHIASVPIHEGTNQEPEIHRLFERAALVLVTQDCVYCMPDP